MLFAVIPIEVEGSRGMSFKITPQDPPLRLAAAGNDDGK